LIAGASDADINSADSAAQGIIGARGAIGVGVAELELALSGSAAWKSYGAIAISDALDAHLFGADRISGSAVTVIDAEASTLHTAGALWIFAIGVFFTDAA
jgi:hypothetical protein